MRYWKLWLKKDRSTKMSDRLLVFESPYTLLKSTLTFDQIIHHAKKKQIKKLIIADQNVMIGAYEFYQKAIKAKLEPFIGVQIITEQLKAIVIAKNDEGLKYLIKISSYLMKHDLQNIEALFSFFHHQIIIFQTIDNTLSKKIEKSETSNFFKTNNFVPIECDIIDVPILNSFNSDEKKLLSIMEAISKNKKVSELEILPDTIDFESITEKKQSMSERRLSQALSFKQLTIFEQKSWHLPNFPGTKEEKQQLFINLCYKGLQKRFTHIDDIYHKRLKYEIMIITQMGFVDYFLIIWDVMCFARKQDIIIGPGRGSAVGSLVSYVLGITKIDPIRYQLLFERFLNIERKSLPDIDIDIEDHRRNEVLAYLREKYTTDHVAQIITFGTFGWRSSLRDVAKSLNIHERAVQTLLGVIDKEKNLSENLASNEKLKKLVIENQELQEFLQLAKKIEGLPRHFSTHAAGVILTKHKILDYVPLLEQEKNIYITQFPMQDLEALGLLKIDFLGLRNLTIIQEILQQIYPDTSKTLSIEQCIPLGDQKTFRLLTNGLTSGIFQFESAGMQQVLRQFPIHKLEDIATILALYRPGPMQFIQTYLIRQKNPQQIEYINGVLKDILEPTYGIIVYQEQIMQIAQKVAGMSLAEADLFRRAIGKKDEKLLVAQQADFIKGAIQNQYTQTDAEQIFNDIMKFANYGFNKSHALAYALIAYQMAYLKTHYPAIFICHLMNNSLHDEKRLSTYLQEATRFQIKILPPDINKSAVLAKVENQQSIRLGFSMIKHIGKIAAEHIVNIRENEPFKSVGDFAGRVQQKYVTTLIFEQLINAYAFSSFSKNQQALKQFMLKFERGNKFIGAQLSFEDETIDEKIIDFTLVERMELETQAFGFHLFAHPLLQYHKNKVQLKDIANMAVPMNVYIEKIKLIQTKKGEKMAFMSVSNMQEKFEVTVFPRTYEKFHFLLNEKQVVLLEIKGQIRNNQKTYIVDKVAIAQKLKSRRGI